MPADGFTKILPRQKHHEFVRQLGLMDISEQLQKETHSVKDELAEDTSKMNLLQLYAIHYKLGGCVDLY